MSPRSKPGPDSGVAASAPPDPNPVGSPKPAQPARRSHPIEPTPPPTAPRNAGRVRFLAPGLSAVGLLVIAVATAQIYRTWSPAIGSQATPTPGIPGASVAVTPTPTIEVPPDKEAVVPGSIAYVRNGLVWIRTGKTSIPTSVSAGGSYASSPAWSSDGQWIYYIDNRPGSGRWYNPALGNIVSLYQFDYPVLTRMHPDGTGTEAILSGLIGKSKMTTFYWMRQPSVAPNGSAVAVISDGPTAPGVQSAGLHLVSMSTHKLSNALAVPTSAYGLADPAYSPDGKLLAYVMEAKSGNYGNPSIWLYNLATHSARQLARGYRNPAWSPDGKYMAAVRVSKDLLNVVILDASTGKQIAVVTKDGESWGPTWSPAGDQLVYLTMSGALAELKLVHISGAGAEMTFRLEGNMSGMTGLDGGSRVAWYIPGKSGPTPTPSAGPSGASPSAS